MDTGPDTAAVGGYGDLLLTSLLVLLLLLGATWLLLRFGLRWLRGGRPVGARRRGPIRVLARASLDAQHGLHLVEAGERTLLLATGAHGVSVLAELDGAAVARDIADADAERRSFHELLTDALARVRGAGEVDAAAPPEPTGGVDTRAVDTGDVDAGGVDAGGVDAGARRGPGERGA